MTPSIDASLAVDAILMLLAVEAAALLLLWRWRGTGIAPRRLLPMLAAGACLLLALRTVLAGAPWRWTALWLGLSFVAHLADIAGRWQKHPDDRREAPPS